MDVKKDEKPKLSEDAIYMLNTAAKHEKGQVLKVSDLTNGILIQAGMTDMNEGGGQRESARWIEAFEELLKVGFIRQVDNMGQVYQVTDAGYKYQDENCTYGSGEI